MMTDKQRDMLLHQLATDVRWIRKNLEGEPEERPASARKKDPRKLYGRTD